MDDISSKYKNYSIFELREVIRGIDKEKYPDLFDKAQKELEDKIIERKSTGNFRYTEGTELFLDSYLDEKLSEITFNDDSILIKSKIFKSYYYIGMIGLISLLFIILLIMGKGNYDLLIAFLVINGGYVWWRILDEIYQYSRSTIINFKLRTVSINIGEINKSLFRILFNQLNGDYTFNKIEGFSWKTTRNIMYGPTDWIFVIKIIFIDGRSTPICFTSTIYFAEKFTSYLNNLVNRNQQ